MFSLIAQIRKEYISWIAIGSIPIVLAIINSNWLFTPIGYLDPWYNVGYFLHYNDESHLNWYYKISRLSWIIPGYIVYKIFNPIVANYILHIGLLLISSFALMSAMRRMFSTRVGFISSALLAAHVPFHGSGGWDYQTAPAGAYYLVTFALVTHAAFSNSRFKLLLLAGMMAAATIHANIIVINLLPLLAMHFFMLTRFRMGETFSARSLIEPGLATLAGAILLTVALGGINASVGRDFFFINVMFKFVSAFVADASQQKSWWLAWSTDWLLNPGFFWYLGSTYAMVIVSLGALVAAASRRWSFDIIAVSLVAQFLIAIAIWSAWQTLGHTAFQPAYFAHPLIPVMFCAIGGLAAMRGGAAEGQDGISFYAVVVTAAIATLVFNLGLPLSGGSKSSLLIILGGTLVGLALLIVSGQNRIMLSLAVISISLANQQIAIISANQNLYSAKPICADRRKHFEGLIAADRFLSSYGRNVMDVYVWWDRTEVLSDSKGCSIEMHNFASSMTSFGSNYLAPPWGGMPSIAELPEGAFAGLRTTSFVAIPTNNGSLVVDMIERFRSKGIILEIVGKQLIRTRPASFYLYLLARKPG